MKTRLRTVVTLFLFLAGGLLGACTQGAPLEDRVKEYWKARQERDVKTAYEYEHPEIRGEELTYHGRMGTGPIMIESVSLESVSVDGERAIAQLSVAYRHATMSRAVKTKISDEWERVGSTWYHHPPPPMPVKLPEQNRVVEAPTPKAD